MDYQWLAPENIVKENEKRSDLIYCILSKLTAKNENQESVTSTVPFIALNLLPTKTIIARKSITNPITPSKKEESTFDGSIIINKLEKQTPGYSTQRHIQILIKAFKLKDIRLSRYDSGLHYVLLQQYADFVIFNLSNANEKIRKKRLFIQTIFAIHRCLDGTYLQHMEK